MISSKNEILAEQLLKQIVTDHIDGISFKNVSKVALIRLSDNVDTAMESIGYQWADVVKAMQMDLKYIATTRDPINRRIDRIIRDYKIRNTSGDEDEEDEDVTPFPFSDVSENGSKDGQSSSDEDDRVQAQDQGQNDPDDGSDLDHGPESDPESDPEPESEPENNPESDTDQEEDREDQEDQDDDNRSPDEEPDPDQDPPQPDDEIADLLKRIVYYNLEHPDNVLNVVLYGPRGTAKTSRAIEVSYSIFGEPPSIMTAPQDKYEIIGYADAHGNPVPTTFIKGYTKPGILLIDELDRMDQTAGIAMNSAISNGLLDTTYMGVLERDPRMTIIATANTAGTGASDEYVTANIMDSSIRDRFVFIPVTWDHDKALSLSTDPALVDFIERWNRACDEAGLGVASASYRVLLMWQAFDELGLPTGQIMDYTLLKGALDPSDLIAISEHLPKRSTVYDTALGRHVEKAKARLMIL